VSGCSFVDNGSSSTTGGGALYLDDSSAAALLHDNLFCGNRADRGSALYLIEATAADTWLSHNVIAGGSGADAAVKVHGGATMVHNAVLDNDAEDAAVYVTEATSFIGNLVAWTTGGVGLELYSFEGDEGEVAYCAFYDNDGGVLDEYDLADGVIDPATWAGAIFDDPLLDGYTPGDDCSDLVLTLAADSPLVDAGQPGWLDADDSVADIGPTGARVDNDGDCFVAAIDTADHDPATSPGGDETSWPFDGTPCDVVAGNGTVGDGGSEDGGATDGGSEDGGATDGGSEDGGTTDGGSEDGGATDGGSEDGGATDGGSDDGGAADGGGDGSEGAEKGCASLPGAPPWLGLVLLGVVMRRRRGRRAGSCRRRGRWPPGARPPRSARP